MQVITESSTLRPSIPELADLGSLLSASVREVPLETDPFHYYFNPQILPTDLYTLIRENLPPDGCYRNYRHGDAILPDGRSARLKLDLFPETLLSLPKPLRAFWSEVSRQVRSPELTEALKRKFAPELERITGKAVEKIRLQPYPVLFRDIAGYKISIHPDSPRKAITSQYYLPEDDTQSHLGTIFHKRDGEGNFQNLRQLEFLPNSGYAFAVSENSWHSVNVMGGSDRPRNSLMIIYYHHRGAFVESLKLIQRKFGVVRALKPQDARYEGKSEM